MDAEVITDTGPIAAWLSRRDKHHEWAREQFAVLGPPLLTCEAVLSETATCSFELGATVRRL